jgi:hypothetical protein
VRLTHAGPQRDNRYISLRRELDRGGQFSRDSHRVDPTEAAVRNSTPPEGRLRQHFAADGHPVRHLSLSRSRTGALRPERTASRQLPGPHDPALAPSQTACDPGDRTFNGGTWLMWRVIQFRGNWSRRGLPIEETQKFQSAGRSAPQMPQTNQSSLTMFRSPQRGQRRKTTARENRPG